MTRVHRVRNGLRRVGARAAFTLVEVLVTLMIVSGIMLALAQLLEAARISRDTIHNIQETQLAGPAIMDLVERDLRAMLIYDCGNDSMLKIKSRVLLGHDADRIDFVTTTDSVVATELEHRLVRSDANEVGYVLRVNPKDDEFLEMYRREDFAIDDEPFEGGAYTFLHDHVKNFEIQVYDEDGKEAKALDDWGTDEEHQGLPKRIELRLTLELAPRLSHEQLRIAPVDKRTVTYTRIIRTPDDLLAQLDVQPVPQVPQLRATTPNTQPPVGGMTGGGAVPMQPVGGAGGGGGRGGSIETRTGGSRGGASKGGG